MRIGEKLALGHGVHIGDGSVIASNAVFTKDVAPYTIVSGVPAIPIWPRFDDDISQVFLELRLWEYAPGILSDLCIRNPAQLLDRLYERITNESLTTYTPTPLCSEDFADG